MQEKTPSKETITFLGTGGARFMIISQQLATGGIWLDLDGTEMLLDPGPGSIVRATDMKLNPENLQAIAISHRHLDHAADVNIMVEAMTRGGFNRHGFFLAPGDAFDEEPILFGYLKKRLDGIDTLEAGKSYRVGNISFSTPVKHLHRAETYGMVFKTAKHTFSYIADTYYFKELKEHYGGSDLLIINLVFLKPRPMADNVMLPADHLAAPDAERLIREIRPKAAILTHFGTSMLEAGPDKIAAVMAQSTGIKVIAARDGMTFDLAELDKIN
jgi:ribonuclease BN (tRNA processing enzyme)